VVVLAFLPLPDVGVYDVAYKVFSVLVAFTAPFSSALFPYYGSAYGRNDHESMSSAVTRASKYSGRTGLRTIGIIVCKKVTDDLLKLLKELKDVEVFFTTRKI
jgi:Na+-driven multidrug efflux pump